MTWSRHLTSILFAVVALGSVSSTAADVVTSLRHDRLYSQLQLEPDDRGVSKSLCYRGVSHRLRSSSRSLSLVDLDLAVHPTVEAATRLIARIGDPMAMSTGPGRTDETIGDRRLVWGEPGSDGGYIAFARNNVTVGVSWKGPFANGLALARAIDEKIRDDRQIAPLGTFAETPEIVSTGVPATATASPPATTRPSRRAPTQYAAPTYVSISPVFRGLGPRENLRVRLLENGIETNFVDSTWDGQPDPKIDIIDTRGRPTQRDRTPEEDGRFQFVVPCTPRQLKLEMVVANSDNVFVTKSVDVEIRPRE